MSGGSYDYFYQKMEEFADAIREDAGCINFSGSSPSLRRAFAEHVRKVAEAARAIEWNDSGDGHGGERELICAVVKPGAELDEALRRAEATRLELSAAIVEARKLARKLVQP